MSSYRDNWSKHKAIGMALLFNPARLIDEVKARPGLYTATEKIDRLDKLNLWKEVGAALFPDWDSLNKSITYGRVLQIQKKWKSLRDAYNRELRFRRMSTKRSRVVYRYFKKMSFLGGFEGTISSDDEGSNGDREYNYVQEIEDDNPEPTMKVEQEPSDEEQVFKKLKKIKKKRRKRKQVESNPSDNEPEAEMEMSMVPMDMNENDSDTDKLFLLSFLPEMRALPLHIKMWTRAQIANIMQEAFSSHYNNTEPGGSNVPVRRFKKDSPDLTDLS